MTTAFEKIADGPKWLTEIRQEALNIYNNRQIPTTKIEAWKYTNLRRFKPENFTQASSVTTVSSVEALPEKVRQRLQSSDALGRIVISGASPIYYDVPDELKKKGVIFSDLKTAISEYPELVQKYLYKGVPAAYQPTQQQIDRYEHIPHEDEDKFTALNAALWDSGFFVYVPKNVELELPLGGFRYLDQDGTMLVSRTLIVVEENAKLTYIDEQDSLDLKAASFGVVELFLAQGSQLRYVAIQNWGRGVTHIQRIKSHLERDATLNSLYVTMGGSLSRTEVQSELDGAGSNSEMLALYFADSNQHFDHYTLQHHIKDHAHSDLLFKGVLTDQARSVFSGLIKVELGAQKTDAYQKNRTLLLSDEARSDSIPQLEINANDVRCSHGSTTGPVDQQELFYLRSRGIPKTIAEKMLVTAFLEDVLNRVPLQNVVSYLENVIADKVGAPKGFNRIP